MNLLEDQIDSKIAKKLEKKPKNKKDYIPFKKVLKKLKIKNKVYKRIKL